MRKSTLVFLLVVGVLLVAIVPFLGAPQKPEGFIVDVLDLASVTSTATLVPTFTYTPTSTNTQVPSPTLTLTPIPSSTNTPALPYNLDVMFSLGDADRLDQSTCFPTLSWDEVLPKLAELGIVVSSGSVQPFRIPLYNNYPNSKTICFGYYIVPSKAGAGYLVYKNSVDIQVIPCYYTEEDIEVGVYYLFRETTPTPSR